MKIICLYLNSSFKPSEKIRPFNVTCEFDSGYGRAIISSKYENDFQYTAIPGGSDGCKDPGCYTDNIRSKIIIYNKTYMALFMPKSS